MSIESIYKRQSSSINDEIEEFIRERKNITEEILAFKKMLETTNYEKGLYIFYLEILSKAIKTPTDVNLFVSIILMHVESSMCLKNSILILRSIRALLSRREFIPLSFYLIKILRLAIEVKNLKKTTKRFDYDSIRLSNDDLDSESLQMFLIKEAMLLIKKQCHQYGSSIGYPEYASAICNELRAYCKVGIFTEVINDLIKFISDRKTYIEEERNKLKINSMDGGKIMEFENTLKKWE